MGALDHGESYRAHLEGVIDRDDINWELKSSIRKILDLHDHWYNTADAYAAEIKKLMDERDALKVSFGCEAEKSAKHLARIDEANTACENYKAEVERLKAALGDPEGFFREITNARIDAALALVKGMHCYAKSGDGRCLHCAMVTALSGEGGSEWVSK